MEWRCMHLYLYNPHDVFFIYDYEKDVLSKVELGSFTNNG